MIIKIEHYTSNVSNNTNIATQYGSVWGRIGEKRWVRLSGGFNLPEIPPEALPVKYFRGGHYVPGLIGDECYAFVAQDNGRMYMYYRSIIGFPAVEVRLEKRYGRLVFTPIDDGFMVFVKPEVSCGARNWIIAPNGAVIGRTSRPGKRCAICQRTFVEADMHSISDDGVVGHVCPNCAAEILQECSICGRYVFYRNITWDKEAYEYRCLTCKEEKTRLPVHHYHLKPSLTFYGSDDELHMGLELEVGGTTTKMCNTARGELNPLSKSERLFHLESDSSIPNEGFEMVTQPCTAEFHKNEFNWEGVMEILNKNEFKTGTMEHPCGMHIHMSKNYLSALRWCVFDWFMYQHRYLFAAIANRSENRFAKFPDEKDKKWGMNSKGRYEYLNFENEDTVEFRLCKSTLSAKRLINTVDFLDSIVNFIKLTKNLEPSLDEFEAFLKKEKPLIHDWYDKTISDWYGRD